MRSRLDYIERVSDALDAVALEFAAELRRQGHTATGALEKSISFRVLSLQDEIIGEMSHNDYGAPVNTGVRPRRVPFSPGSGAKTSKFIEALFEWVKFKRIAGGLDKDIWGATFAIARNMKKQGIPTKGSYAFTSNGRRTKWVDETIKEGEGRWENELGNITTEYLDSVFDALLQKVAKTKGSPISISI